MIQEKNELQRARDWLREKMRKRVAAACPCCGRRVVVTRRRPHRRQVETLVAIGLESRRRRSQSRTRPWIHVERDLIQTGLAPVVGRDWTQLEKWGVLERKSSDRDPEASGVGFWRLTDLGAWALNHPSRPSLFEWVDTWNGQTIKRSEKRVSLNTALGREFVFDELEIRRAS